MERWKRAKQGSNERKRVRECCCEGQKNRGKKKVSIETDGMHVPTSPRVYVRVEGQGEVGGGINERRGCTGCRLLVLCCRESAREKKRK